MKSAKQAEEELKEALHPSEDVLKGIYSFWAKKFRWSVEEAAALIMGADPQFVIAAYHVLSAEDRKRFDRMVDLIRRKFPIEVFPADLPVYAATIEVVNDLLWSAIDHYHPREQKPIRKSARDKEREDEKPNYFRLRSPLWLPVGPEKPIGWQN